MISIFFIVILMQINIFYYVFYKCADIILFQSALYAGLSISGVVERERMGTVFPHKKLSGNGVPTRELLRYIFLLLLLNLLFSLLPCYNTSHTSKLKLNIRICTLKLISMGI